MIWVVNFPFCNYSAISRFLRLNKFNFQDLDNKTNIEHKDVIILPGVGSFEQGMSYLDTNHLSAIIQQHAEAGGRIIGICLGLQLLFNQSEESPGHYGLGIFDGDVVKLNSTPTFNVPHIGWNAVQATEHTPTGLRRFFDHSGLSIADFYFVHSYYCIPKDQSISIGYVADIKPHINVAFNENNVFAFQFHPEKSGSSGYQLLLSLLKK